MAACSQRGQGAFPDAIGPGAKRLEYRAELRNRGAEAATVRGWRWWVTDSWERSYCYLPLESQTELLRVGEERKQIPLEEGEEGEAFCVPAGSFATLRFEGCSSSFGAIRKAGPRGAHRGSRRPSAECVTTSRRGKSRLPRGRPWDSWRL